MADSRRKKGRAKKWKTRVVRGKRVVKGKSKSTAKTTTYKPKPTKADLKIAEEVAKLGFIDLDYTAMRRICLMPEEEFRTLPGYEYNAKEEYIFKDNDADILAVAHLDSVVWTHHFYHIVIEEDRKSPMPMILNGQLDDRLGAYMIVEYLHRYGFNYDVLLTTNEERGASTASAFHPDKQYNWMFEFDREGEDAVIYHYRGMRQPLTQCGFKVGFGSYSDISDLSHLGCGGINVGTGVHNYHGAHAWSDVGELEANIRRFLKFWVVNKDIHHEHDPKRGRAGGYYQGYGVYGHGHQGGYVRGRNGVWKQVGTTSGATTKTTKTTTTTTTTKTTPTTKTTSSAWIKCKGCDGVFNSAITTAPGYCKSCSKGGEFAVCDLCFEVVPVKLVVEFIDGSILCEECADKLPKDGTAPNEVLDIPEDVKDGEMERCDLCGELQACEWTRVGKDLICENCMTLCA